MAPVDKINELFAKYGATSEAAKKAAEEQAKALEDQNKALEEAAKKAADIEAKKQADILAAEQAIQDGYKKTGDSILSSMTEALKKGTTQADFSKTILDMLRNMAIDAAVIAGGYAEKFKAIGAQIAQALSDGFQQPEVDKLKAQIEKIYTSASSDVSKINKLFPGYATGTDYAPGGWSWVGENGPELMNVPKGAQIIPSGASAALAQSVSTVSTKGDTNFYIQSPSPLDPLQTTRLIRETQESLAFAGAF